MVNRENEPRRIPTEELLPNSCQLQARAYERDLQRRIDEPVFSTIESEIRREFHDGSRIRTISRKWGIPTDTISRLLSSPVSKYSFASLYAQSPPKPLFRANPSQPSPRRK
jgi:hypothetical protein